MMKIIGIVVVLLGIESACASHQENKLIQEGGSFIYARSLFKVGEVWAPVEARDVAFFSLLEGWPYCNAWLIQYLQQECGCQDIHIDDDSRIIDISRLLVKASRDDKGALLLSSLFYSLSYAYPLQNLLFVEDEEHKTFVQQIRERGNKEAREVVDQVVHRWRMQKIPFTVREEEFFTRLFEYALDSIR